MKRQPLLFTTSEYSYEDMTPFNNAIAVDTTEFDNQF
jgi:hypothetical protein